MKKFVYLLVISIFSFIPFTIYAEEVNGINTQEVIKINSVNINLNNEYYNQDEVVLNATIEPLNYTEKIIWKSSNDNIANIVDNSKIIFKNTGNVKIIAQGEEGNILYEKEINVYNKIEKIEIVEGDKLEVSLEKDYLLNVKVYPENTKEVYLRWIKPENNDIVIKTWHQGENEYLPSLKDNQRSIKAYKEGTYTINVETLDGKFSDSIIITAVKKINEINVYPPAVNYNETYDAGVIYLDENPVLIPEYYIYPTDVVNKKLHYASTDNNVFVVDQNGKITAKSVGKAKIIVKSDDGNAKREFEIEVRKNASGITKAPKIMMDRYNNTIAIYYDGVNGATSYNIYRSTNNKKWSKIANVKEYYYYDEKLTYGTTYYYKVEAINKSGSKYSNVLKVKVLPEKLYSLSFSKVTNSKLKISWYEADVNGYEIYRSTNSKKGFKKVKTISKNKTTSFTNSILKANTKYYYKIRTYRTVKGKKIYGDYSKVFSVKTAPQVPKITISTNEYDSLKLNIKTVKGASYYEVYRSNSKNGTFVKVGDAKGKTYINNNLELTKKYYYKVKACNSDKNCSTFSGIVNKKVSLKKPSITLKKNGKTVNIKISTIKGANGYEIYRSTKKKGKYSLVKNDNNVSEKLKKGTYYYKARSYTIVNNKKIYSSYSSIKSIKIK